MSEFKLNNEAPVNIDVNEYDLDNDKVKDRITLRVTPTKDGGADIITFVALSKDGFSKNTVIQKLTHITPSQPGWRFDSAKFDRYSLQLLDHSTQDGRQQDVNLQDLMPPTFSDSTVDGRPVVSNTSDKLPVDAVIKRHMAQISYGYNKELPANPTLAGKITIKFVIAKDGTVSSATVKESTMPGEAGKRVGDALCSEFKKFQFPEPKDGSSVIVNYPFEFIPG